MVRNKFLIASVATMILALTFFRSNHRLVTKPDSIRKRESGHPAWLLTNPASNNEIAGYANLTSVNKGGQIWLFISATDPRYRISVSPYGLLSEGSAAN